MRCWDRCCATTTTGILNDARVTRHTHSHSCMQIKWHAHEWRQDCGRMKWIYADDSDRWGHHMASLASSENQTAFISNGFVSRVFSVLFISPVRKCCDLGIRTAQRHQSVAIKAIRKFSQCNGIWSSLARNFNNSAIATNSFNSFFCSIEMPWPWPPPNHWHTVRIRQTQNEEVLTVNVRLIERRCNFAQYPPRYWCRMECSSNWDASPLGASPFEINRIGLSMLLTAVASLSVAHTLRSYILENAFGDAAKMIADEPNRYYMV